MLVHGFASDYRLNWVGTRWQEALTAEDLEAALIVPDNVVIAPAVMAPTVAIASRNWRRSGLPKGYPHH